MTNDKRKTSTQKAKVDARSSRNNKSTPAKQVINKTSAEDRYRTIANVAYYRAEKRGFMNGDAVQDWLEAEMEVDQTR